MYKIVAAINSMINHPEKIGIVLRNEGEIFFVYDDQFKWSMSKGPNDDYFLHYYPTAVPLDYLATIDNWAAFKDYVSYATSEIKTKEAYESFSELYQVIQGKLYDIDAVLDSIINTAA